MPGAGLAVVLACAGATAGTPAPRAVHHRLNIRNLTFQPRDLQVAPGDTLSWVNHDIVSHTVTASDARWDSGEVPPGGEFTLIAEGAEAVPYQCRYHPTMTGNLVVR
jgi:plastocyanin